MKIGVIGGSGLIGSKIVQKLVAQGHQAVAELEGISWLSTHTHRDRLVGYLARLLREGDRVPQDVLRTLLSASKGETARVPGGLLRSIGVRN